jgi:hypothetical protein
MIGHAAIKYPGIIIKNHIQKIAVAFPHGKAVERINPVPLQVSLIVLRLEDAAETIYPEDKAEPVFTIRAKPRPTDGSPQ